MPAYSQSDARTGGEQEADAERTWISRWMPVGLVGLVIVAVMRQASLPVKDPDTWWHLRMGADFWNGDRKVWDPGPWTPVAREDWLPRDWLPQLAFHRVEEGAGLPGIAWAFGLSLILFLVAVFWVCRRWSDPLASAVAAVVCFLGASASLAPRPQMISFILMAVVTYAWLRTAEDGRARWWLVPLTWIWACSHGIWIGGVAVGVAAVVGMALDRRLRAAQLRRAVGVVAASLVAAALTPAGPGLLPAAFGQSGKWSIVDEWSAPDFTELAPAAALLMVLVVAWTDSRRRHLPWSQLALVALAFVWTLLAARSVALGAIVVAPIFAQCLQQWIGPVRFRVDRREIGALLACAVLALTWLGFRVDDTASAPGEVPRAFDTRLEAIPAGEAVLNQYVLGGWITWRHPDLVPVVDGFTDAYSVDQIDAYGRAYYALDGWDAYVERSGAEVAVLARESPLAVALQERLGWTVTATDGDYVLLEEPRP